MAKRLKKLILPFEAVATDRAALQRNFADMPNLINTHSRSKVEKALADQLRRLSLPKRAGSPERRFLLGLAYLMGVDVEIDREQAVSLIKEAASKHYPEATATMADLYQYGIGVPRTLARAKEYRLGLHRWAAPMLLSSANAGAMEIFSVSTMALTS